MKMIARLESRSEAEERAAFLRSRGIATRVTDMLSLRLNLAHQGRYRAALWVLLADQYDDAIALLDNPDHRVEHPLSEQEFHRIETEGADSARKTLIRWLLLTVVALAGLAALVVWSGL